MTENDDYDVRVGAAIQALRKARNWTQDKLAEEVTARGTAWRQQTVLKVEKGQRPLRLREADSVARALDVHVDALVQEELVIDYTVMLVRATTRVADAWETFTDTGVELITAVDSLKGTLRWVASRDWQNIDSGVLAEAATLTQVDIVQQASALAGVREVRVQESRVNYERGVEAKPFQVEDWT